MQTKTIGLAVVAAVLAIVNFLFMQLQIFPPIETPPASLLPAFIFLAVWDAIAFGVGIALLIYLAMNYAKWPKGIRSSLLVLFFIALWFSILNWVHDGLHETGASPPNFLFLALVEYTFHFPWLIFAVGLAFVAVQLAKTYTK